MDFNPKQIENAQVKEKKLLTFLIAAGTAMLLFVPYMIQDGGMFFFYGDFNVQQVPFYMLAHESVRSGNIFWSHFTDLGANFIGSYSFYLLGSPFFLITLIFPNAAVPYLMGPLLILKFACAALAAYFFLRRFVSPNSALIGGLLYAFSGFSVYNVFFNHFHEAIIIFPLILWGLELYMTENRRGVFAGAIALAAIMNYFFFVGMVVFVALYWIMRALSGAWELNLKKFLWLGFEAALGVGIAAIILIPSYLAISGNPRVGNSGLTGWNMILYHNNQRPLNIMQIFFFPPDLPARPVFFPDSNAPWASLGAWLPVFGMVGCIAFIKSKSGHWLKRLIIISFAAALIPFLNSTFYMFNPAYWARWIYMLVLMVVLATVISLEDKEVDWTGGLKWAGAITVLTTLFIGFAPAGINPDGSVTRWGLFTEHYPLRFWVTCIVAIVSVIIVGLLIPYIKENHNNTIVALRTNLSGAATGHIKQKSKNFFITTVVMVCGVSLIYSHFFIHQGREHLAPLSGDVHTAIIPHFIQGSRDMDVPLQANGRVDFYRGMDNRGTDNLGMFLRLPSIQTFHSIVPYSLMEFHEFNGTNRSVASRPLPNNAALRALLGVEFLLDYEQPNPNPRVSNPMFSNGSPTMPGFTHFDTQNYFRIYQNENFVPIGFGVTYFATRNYAEAVATDNRAHLMLKAAIVEDENMLDVRRFMRNIQEQRGQEGNTYGDYSYEALVADAAARRAVATHHFNWDNRGFDARINLPSEQLVVFAIPHDSGWSATVNGNSVDIMRVNIGLMGIVVPAGEEIEIRFDYMPDGFVGGILITIVSLAGLAAYIVIFHIMDKEKKLKDKPRVPSGFAAVMNDPNYDPGFKNPQEAEFSDLIAQDLMIDEGHKVKFAEEEVFADNNDLNFNAEDDGFGFDDGTAVDNDIFEQNYKKRKSDEIRREYWDKNRDDL